MKISRDVIYDLLPGYFAGEASADTRAFIQEYFDTDPEFRRMAERFQAVLDDTRRRGVPDSEQARERATFDRVRSEAKRRHEARASAVAFAFAAAFSAFILFLSGWGRFGYAHPGFILACAFGLIAVVTFIASYFVKQGDGHAV
jgi:hypothetical protein